MSCSHTKFHGVDNFCRCVKWSIPDISARTNDGITNKTLARPSRKSDEKEKEKKKNLKWQLQSFSRYPQTQNIQRQWLIHFRPIFSLAPIWCVSGFRKGTWKRLSMVIKAKATRIVSCCEPEVFGITAWL